MGLLKQKKMNDSLSFDILLGPNAVPNAIDGGFFAGLSTSKEIWRKKIYQDWFGK